MDESSRISRLDLKHINLYCSIFDEWTSIPSMEFASSSLSSSSSSSFLTSEPHFIHDVFINFGGEDIGRRFVSHLHYVLLQSQFKTFISQENLHERMKLEEHMRAIGHTKITIIVFSKSYTESACSLLELEKIIDCHETFGQIVLPVFYEIDPSDVRYQKDDFGKALEEAAHKSYSGEQLEHALSKWSHALTTTAGKEKDYVTEILNGCGLHAADIGITVLIERGLVKVGRNNKLEMHCLLQDMGREIKKRREMSRLWLHPPEKDDVVIESTGTEVFQALSLNMHSTKADCFEAHTFANMKELRLLRLDHVQVVGDYGHISKQLRWICWKGFPSKYIPNNFYMGNVIAIDLRHSHLQLVWKQPPWKPAQGLERLKFLNLSHSKYLKETPDFSRLPSLEQLILKDCPSLRKVHQSIGDLSNILVINLKDCTCLRYLPREIYKLRSLKTLVLSGCSKLSPIDITQVKSLVNIIA